MRLTLSERYVVGLNFLLIAACAYFAARSFNDIVARRLTVIPPAPRIAASARAPRELARTAYDVIVDRDIFNAVKQQAVTPAAPPPPTAADLHIKLVGTSHLSWTKPFAVFEDQNSHDQEIYRQGDQIADACERSRWKRGGWASITTAPWSAWICRPIRPTPDRPRPRFPN